MDPLSITASALSVAASVLRSAAYIKSVADEYRNGPSVISDLGREVTTVQAALRQVEAALQRDAQSIWRFGLQHVFELSVEGCRDTLQHIDADFKTLFGRGDWRARIAVWWNAGEMRRLLATLDTKKGSLMLLVQALSLHSMQEMQELLEANMRTLDIARLGLDDMVPSYPAYTSRRLDSVASTIGSAESVLGHRDSVVSTTRFLFDDICFTSNAYRRAVASTRANKASKEARGKTTAPLRDSTALSIVEEADADTIIASPGAAAKSASKVVPIEEHEAVVRQLREQEALLQQILEQTQPPAYFTPEGTDEGTPLPSQGTGRLGGEETRGRTAKSDRTRLDIPNVSHPISRDETPTTLTTPRSVPSPSQGSPLSGSFQSEEPKVTGYVSVYQPPMRLSLTPSPSGPRRRRASPGTTTMEGQRPSEGERLARHVSFPDLRPQQQRSAPPPPPPPPPPQRSSPSIRQRLDAPAPPPPYAVVQSAFSFIPPNSSLDRLEAPSTVEGQQRHAAPSVSPLGNWPRQQPAVPRPPPLLAAPLRTQPGNSYPIHQHVGAPTPPPPYTVSNSAISPIMPGSFPDETEATSISTQHLAPAELPSKPRPASLPPSVQLRNDTKQRLRTRYSELREKARLEEKERREEKARREEKRRLKEKERREVISRSLQCASLGAESAEVLAGSAADSSLMEDFEELKVEFQRAIKFLKETDRGGQTEFEEALQRVVKAQEMYRVLVTGPDEAAL